MTDDRGHIGCLLCFVAKSGLVDARQIYIFCHQVRKQLLVGIMSLSSTTSSKIGKEKRVKKGRLVTLSDSSSRRNATLFFDNI
jgi:hypothetical protein